MKVKVCGMKYQDNIEAVAAAKPDFLGFIFYEKSPRNFEGDFPEIPDSIKKVGVFVEAPLDFVIEKVRKFDLDAVQLHGSESAKYCEDLRSCFNRPDRFLKTVRSEEVEEPALSEVEVWKVFSIKDQFDFDRLTPYEGIVDYFLFDTKGKEKGGNGYTFDWSVLNSYPSSTPFILSGGIGLDEIDQIRMILKTSLPIHAIDVNSKLEDKPGLKNIDKVKHFLTNQHIRRDVV